MKRAIILILSVFLLGGLCTQVSGRIYKGIIIFQQKQKDEKIKIRTTDLPQGVTEVLNKEYQGWSLTSNIYEIRKPSGFSYYQVELQKGMQTMTFNIEENGNKLSEVDLKDEEQ